MSQLFFLLFLLGCPLMMVFMMRGMHGGGQHDRGHPAHDGAPTVIDRTAQDARIAELEREVASLRTARLADGAPDPVFVDALHERLRERVGGTR